MTEYQFGYCQDLLKDYVLTIRMREALNVTLDNLGFSDVQDIVNYYPSLTGLKQLYFNVSHRTSAQHAMILLASLPEYSSEKYSNAPFTLDQDAGRILLLVHHWYQTRADKSSEGPVLKTPLDVLWRIRCLQFSHRPHATELMNLFEPEQSLPLLLLFQLQDNSETDDEGIMMACNWACTLFEQVPLQTVQNALNFWEVYYFEVILASTAFAFHALARWFKEVKAQDITSDFTPIPNLVFLKRLTTDLLAFIDASPQYIRDLLNSIAEEPNISLLCTRDSVQDIHSSLVQISRLSALANIPRERETIERVELLQQKLIHLLRSPEA
ncbi:hypothetical protein EIP86_001640 [Pleurotus ostreatoroseus]|nr:hypothetical protein EIP86_001640 [Pleurotus ostreatoroseus]